MDQDSSNGPEQASRVQALLAVREPWEEWTLVAAATLMAAVLWLVLTSEIRFIDDSLSMASTLAIAAATLVLTRLWIRRKAPREAAQTGNPR